MPFCSNCGQQIADGAKFCPECGAPTGVQAQNQRTEKFAGEIRKCPNCGNNLAAFEAICPACGHELRNTEASMSVQQFAEKVADLHANRETSNAKSIADFIKNYPIPNSREDLTEFIVLAASNIDLAYINGAPPGGKPDWPSRNLVTEAWRSKFEQAYQKAKIVFGNNPEFKEIQEYYSNKQKEIRKAKTGIVKGLVIALSIVVLMCAAIYAPFILMDMHFTNAHNREEQRLEAIVGEVQDCIANEDFDTALVKANSIYYTNSGYSSRVEEHWDNVREDLIAMIERKSGIPSTSNKKDDSASNFLEEVISDATTSVSEGIDSVKDAWNTAFSDLFG